jgi:hypothetical protein
LVSSVYFCFSCFDFRFSDEPVWAIGTGLVCPKEVAQQVHAYIRSVIAEKYGPEIAKKILIQYGGSVNQNNARELMMMPDIDGCLVGGASLVPTNFARIVNWRNEPIPKKIQPPTSEELLKSGAFDPTPEELAKELPKKKVIIDDDDDDEDENGKRKKKKQKEMLDNLENIKSKEKPKV